jgi:guanosine-3',5'-bis(diphosphate) 3'-pyrophosphohydrolase
MTESIVPQMIAAMHFAAQKHRQQRRKGAEQIPYINHPIELLDILANRADITDPIVLLAALLHDTVEDTDATLIELEAHFGAEVAQVVAELTDDKSLPKAIRKQLQVEHAPHMSDRAKLIKLADKISNVRDIAHSPPADWSRQRRWEYCEWGKRVVDQMRGTHAGLEALFDEVYTEAVAICQPSSSAPP